VPEELGMSRTAKIAIRALMSLMNDVQMFIQMQMQHLGETLTPWWINSEVGTLAGDEPPHGKLFRYLRYDVRLELPWIEENLGPEVKEVFGRNLTDIDVIRMRSMDDPTIVEPIYKLAKIAAEKQVKAEHWVGDVPDWCDPNVTSLAAARREARILERAKMPSRTMLPRMLGEGFSRLRATLIKIRNPGRK
jgi:hypothetical protein